MVNWRDYIVLKEGEYIVETFNCGDYDIEEEMGLVMSGRGAHHAYVLTNKKLIVLLRELDLKREEVSSYEIKKQFLLETIKDINWFKEADSPYLIFLTIYTDQGSHMFENAALICGGRRTWDTPRAVSYLKKRIIDLKEMKRTLVMDFSALRGLIEKGGIVLTALKCPHCSAPIKMPKDGTETLCDHCGSTIYAQDVFKKIKASIS